MTPDPSLWTEGRLGLLNHNRSAPFISNVSVLTPANGECSGWEVEVWGTTRNRIHQQQSGLDHKTHHGSSGAAPASQSRRTMSSEEGGVDSLTAAVFGRRYPEGLLSAVRAARKRSETLMETRVNTQ